MLGLFVLVYFVISGHWRLLCLDGPGNGQPKLGYWLDMWCQRLPSTLSCSLAAFGHDLKE